MNKVHEANQRLFNEAWTHVHRTGKPSVTPDWKCSYDGIGCAFAPAISEYLSEMESQKASQLVSNYPDQLHSWAVDCDLVAANLIQEAHDRAAAVAETEPDLFMKEFKYHMLRVADEFGLTVPEEN